MGNDDRTTEFDDESCASGNMRDSLILSIKLVSLLIIVSTLSVGSVLLAAFFLWLCFEYPKSGTTLLQVIIPSLIGTVAVYYGKKLLSVLTSPDEIKLIGSKKK